MELDDDGLTPVPTVADLARRGLARQVTADSAWTIDPAGYAALNAAMKHNADAIRDNNGLRRRLEAAASRPRPRR